MFETFIMITLLAIGLSQLIPDSENAPGERKGMKKRTETRFRSDNGAGRAANRRSAVAGYRRQAHCVRTWPNSPGGTGRLKKNPCIW